jgi:ascorbate-specific PTS system EIIC-type component UlaA
MAFTKFLLEVLKLLGWWIAGIIGIILGLYLLWIGFKGINWFIIIPALILIFISGAAIYYGTHRYRAFQFK